MCFIETFSYTDASGKIAHGENIIECEPVKAGHDCPEVFYRDLGEQPNPHQVSQSSTAAQNSPTYSTFSSDRSAVGTAVSSHSASSNTVTPGLSRHYSQKGKGERRRSTGKRETVEMINTSSGKSTRRRASRGHSRDASGSSTGLNEAARVVRRVPAPEPPSPAESIHRRRLSLSGLPPPQRPSSSSAALGPISSFSRQQGAQLEERAPPVPYFSSRRPRSALIVADSSAGDHSGNPSQGDSQDEPYRPSRPYSSEPTSTRRSNNGSAPRGATASHSRRGSGRRESIQQRPILHQQHQQHPTSPSSGSFRPAQDTPDPRQSPSRSNDSSPASVGSRSMPPGSPARRSSGGATARPANDQMARASLREEQRKRDAQDRRVEDLEQQISEDVERLADVTNQIKQLTLTEQRQEDKYEEGGAAGGSSGRRLFRNSGKASREAAAQQERKKELQETRGRIKSLEQQSQQIFRRKNSAQTELRVLRQAIEARGEGSTSITSLVEEDEEEAGQEDSDEEPTLTRISERSQPDQQRETVYESEVRSPSGTVRRHTTEVRGGVRQTFETKIVQDQNPSRGGSAGVVDAAGASSSRDEKVRGKRRAPPTLTLSDQ